MDAAPNDLARLRAKAFRTYLDVPEALRAYNLRELRDTLRAVFERHPVLEDVRFDLRSDYNDAWYNVHELDGLRVNGMWTDCDALLFDPSDRSEARDDPWFHVHRTHDDDPWEQGDDVWKVPAHFRAKYPAETEAAFDLFDALHGLTARYGEVFWLDTVGFNADVVATREALTVSLPERNEQRIGPEELGENDFRFEVKSAYLDTPERASLLAPRQAAARAHADAVDAFKREQIFPAARSVFEAFPGTGVLASWIGTYGGWTARAGVHQAGGWQLEVPPSAERFAETGDWERVAHEGARLHPAGERFPAVLWAWAGALDRALGDLNGLLLRPVGEDSSEHVFIRDDVLT